MEPNGWDIFLEEDIKYFPCLQLHLRLRCTLQYDMKAHHAELSEVTLSHDYTRDYP